MTKSNSISTPNTLQSSLNTEKTVLSSSSSSESESEEETLGTEKQRTQLNQKKNPTETFKSSQVNKKKEAVVSSSAKPKVKDSKKRKICDNSSSSEDGSSSSSDSESEQEKLKTITRVTSATTTGFPESETRKQGLIKSDSIVKNRVNNQTSENKDNRSTNENNDGKNKDNGDVMDISVNENTDAPIEKKRRRKRRRKKPAVEETTKMSDWTPKFTRVTTIAPSNTEGRKHFHFESDGEICEAENEATNVNNNKINCDADLSEIPVQTIEDQGRNNDWEWSTGIFPQTTHMLNAMQNLTHVNEPNHSQKSSPLVNQKPRGKGQISGNLFAETQVFSRKK